MSKIFKELDELNNPIIDIAFVIIAIELLFLSFDIQIVIPIAVFIRLFALILSLGGIGLVIWRNQYRRTNLDKFDESAIRYVAPILSGIFTFLMLSVYLSQTVVVSSNLSTLTILSIGASSFGIAYAALCENVKPSKIKAQIVIFTPLISGLILSLITIKTSILYINLFSIIIIALLIATVIPKKQNHVVHTPE